MSILGSLFCCGKREESFKERSVREMLEYHQANAMRIAQECAKKGLLMQTYNGSADGSSTIKTKPMNPDNK